MVSSPSPEGTLSKWTLLSNIIHLYDILGWCSQMLIKPKRLLQRLWENGLNWEDPVSQAMCETWVRWCGELPVLYGHLIPGSYFPKEVDGASTQLHGFCDASELASAGVVYLSAVDQIGSIHVSLVMTKTKVALSKRLNIPVTRVVWSSNRSQTTEWCSKIPWYFHQLNLHLVR